MSAEAIIAANQGYASEMTDAAKNAMEDATSAVQGVGYIIPNWRQIDLPPAPTSSIDLTVPTLDLIDFTLPSEPGAAPSYQAISDVNPGNAPTLLASAPTLTMPSKPSQLSPFQGAEPSINTSITFPSPPALLLDPPLDLPVLPDRVVPTAPNIILPQFTAMAPADPGAAPTDLDQKVDAIYRSATPQMIATLDGYVDTMLDKYDPDFRGKMARVNAQLDRFLAGGSGFAPAVEDAIYGRARDKNLAEARRVEQAALSDMADRGFTMPPGALFAAGRAARQAAADNNAAAAADIVKLQAEMEQRNLQFAVTTSAGLRNSMLQAALGYHQTLTTINGQALDMAKAVLSAIVETYNTAVRVFTAKLDAYRAEASVYETKLKGAMAAVDLYKAEIDALQALTNVDRAKVDIYRARIDALNGLAGVYRAQIDAVQGRVGLEKLKLDVFQARVQAYSAQVQAKNGEWGAYQAELQGQGELVKIYTARVQAYGAEVQGWRAKVEAMGETVRAQAATNSARSDQYRAEVSAYSAVVQARGDVARTLVQVEGQKLQAFSAEVNAKVAQAEVASNYYKAVSYTIIENARGNLEAQLKQADSVANYGRTIAQLSDSNARTFANLAAAAMSGMNSLAAEIKNT